MNEKFFIYKTASLKSEKPDLSFVPMMTRRKLSPIARITFALMNECCGENNVNLVFSSQFGEVDRLEALILQYTDDGEVSPISFGSSVHNAAVGAYSLFKNIKNKYNAISAGKNNVYGHPHQITLQTLKNSKIFTTKNDGAIKINLKNLTIKTVR